MISRDALESDASVKSFKQHKSTMNKKTIDWSINEARLLNYENQKAEFKALTSGKKWTTLNLELKKRGLLS